PAQDGSVAYRRCDSRTRDAIVPVIEPNSARRTISPDSQTGVFRVGHEYADRGNPHLAGDEFSRWFLLEGRTIGMTGGIRPRSFLHLKLHVPAFIVLVTTHISADYSNPWDDVIDEGSGVIYYWGDAKFSERGKLCDDFTGNRCLRRTFEEILTGDRSIVPPILHFQRPKSGKLIFTGLCALEAAHL